MSVALAGEQRVRIIDDARVRVYDDSRVRALTGDVVVYGSDTDGGSGDSQLYSYINILSRAPNGTYQATVDYLLATPGSITGLSANKTVYLFDGTDGGILQSTGPDTPPVMYERQPMMGDTYHSHIYSEGSTISTAQILVECRQDQPVGSPHIVTVSGALRETASSGSVLLRQFDKLPVNLSGDLTVTLPATSFGDDPSRSVQIFVEALNGHTVTIDAPGTSVDGDTLAEGFYLIESTGSDWSYWIEPGVSGGGDGARARNQTTITTTYTVLNTDGLVVCGGSGGYTVTLPASGFTAGQEIMLWGAQDSSPVTVTTAAELFTFDGALDGDGSISLALNDVVTLVYLLGDSDVPGWRIVTPDPATGTGDVVGPASSVDGRPALFDGTTGKLLKQASAALGTAAFAATTDFLGATAGAGGALSGNYPNPGLNEETVQDIVGAMVSSNTETGIAVTYDDTNGKLDFAVPTPTVDVVSNVATSSILGRVTAGSGDSEELTASQVRTLLGLVIGTDVLAATAVRHIDFRAASVSVAFTSDTVVASCNLGSAFASGDQARLNAVIEVKNSAGSNRTYTPKVKLGSSAVATMTAQAYATGTTVYMIIEAVVTATGSATQRLSAKAANDATNLNTGRYAAGTETTSGITVDFTLASNSATGTQTAEMVQGMCTVHR